MKKVFGLAVLMLMLGSGLTWSQEAPEGQVGQEFVLAASEGDLYELTSSQLAVQQASDDDVVAFAERMVDDHTMTTEQLKEIADSAGMELATEPGAAHQVMISRLMQLEGTDFDRAYMQQQVLAHQMAVSLYQIAAESAEDEQLRAFAAETLPALEEHLAMAQELVQQVGDQ